MLSKTLTYVFFNIIFPIMQNNFCYERLNIEKTKQIQNEIVELAWRSGCVIYYVLVSVSCPKALFHLESDNLFRITVVVADWLG